MDWYQIPKLLKKNYWSEPYYDTGGGEQMMTTYSHPIYDKDGNLIAVLTADVSLNWLTELVAKSWPPSAMVRLPFPPIVILFVLAVYAAGIVQAALMVTSRAAAGTAGDQLAATFQLPLVVKT